MAVLTALTAALVTGAITAAAVAEAAVVVGVTLSIAGAVTKDKTMSLVGAGLSLGAGVAGMMDPTLLAGLYVSGAEAAAGSQLGNLPALTGADQLAGQTGTLMHGAGTTVTTGPAGAMGGAFNVAPVAPTFTPDASLLSSAAPGAMTAAAQPSIGAQPSDYPAGMQAPVPVEQIGNVAPPAPPAAPGTIGPQLNTGTSPIDTSYWADALSKIPKTVIDSNDVLSPTTKAFLAMSAGQAGAGMAGGYFTGLSAEERLELDRLINEQRQNQVTLLNKQGSYVPKLAFTSPKFGPAGLLSAPKVGA